MSNDSDEWASKFVGKLTEKQKDAADENALLRQKQAMIRGEAPYLWDKLRSAINERAGSVNALAKGEYFKASAAVQGYTEHTLESPAGHLSLFFQHEVPIIKYRFTKAFTDARATPKPVNGDVRFQVFDEKVWFLNSGEERMDVSQTAEYFLEMHS
ncbi:MAG: hypothetical protein V7638_890 [Acidobacteriota bacterium]